jgi:hypothetical protein
MPTLPASAPQTTLPGEFIQFYFNSVLIAAGMTGEYGMRYEGEWIQPFGTDTPLRNPRMKSGTGTLDRVTIYGNRLADVLIASGLATAQQLGTSGIDLRLYPLTAMVRYNDGVKQTTTTLLNVYIEEERTRLDGNSIVRTNVSYTYTDQATV